MQKCNKCNILKDLECFSKNKASKKGIKFTCKECDTKRSKLYYINIIDEIKEKHKLYFEKNKDYLNQKQKEYYILNKDYIKEYMYEYQKNKLETDSLYKLKVNYRNRVRKSFKSKYWQKNNTTQHILGCEFIDFKNYIESKFTENMNWNNQGKWHIDHIIPLYLATTEEELIKLCHYTNLQPLWAEDNLKKGIKYESQ